MVPLLLRSGRVPGAAAPGLGSAMGGPAAPLRELLGVDTFGCRGKPIFPNVARAAVRPHDAFPASHVLPTVVLWLTAAELRRYRDF